MEWLEPALVTIDRLTVAPPGTAPSPAVSLRIPAGRIGVVVGNGARRRALFECLAALRRPLSGRIGPAGPSGEVPTVAYLSDAALHSLAAHVPMREQAALWAWALQARVDPARTVFGSRYVGSCTPAELTLAWCRVATASAARLILLDVSDVEVVNDPSCLDLLIGYAAVRSGAVVIGVDRREMIPRGASWSVELER